ncbi:hypothetical protein [Nocardia huaxiensis]|uniref:Secreted protein n=1 Tax=Nocardia huaxiensis TaxID=2755382 RepID=A0A7D6VGK8_9NOCA|nr:hypothetical protein [Nocardia huaxiensis]QLY33982.1 hypothetical protein H0264_18655 [Nocardia huaxiensis]UFS99116.1 hypothetical protein LPY97_15055 [Nocardia huaxiensis]
MFSQLLGTLSGVIIGGALTFLASYVNERSKWNRAQAARWDERRLLAYADYLIVTRKMHALAGQLVSSRRSTLAPAATHEAELAQLAELELERIQRWQEVQLLGSTHAIEVGDELNRCTWTLEWFAQDKLNSVSDWNLINREAYRLRKDFGTAARLDLGVTGHSLPKPEWLDEWTPRNHLANVRERTQTPPVS